MVSGYRTQVLREVWRITERRGGAVFHTEFVERRWIDLADADDQARPDNDDDLLWASVPMSYLGPLIRSLKVSEA